MLLPIAIHKEKDSVYGVTVPDVPGCHSFGEAIEEAISNTKEAIYGHLQTLVELGEKFDVTPSAIADLVADDDLVDATWAMVEIDLAKVDPTPERVNISLPRYVLRRIDEFTKSSHDTRSGFLARAAMHELEHASS